MSNLIKKEELISYFLEIRGNEQTEKLRNCRSQCERFLLSEDDNDIRDLFNVINALMVYFETGDKEESRKWVNYVWKKLYSKKDFSLFDIRIMNHILFTEPDIEKVVKIVEEVLTQLEIYKFHEDYLRIKLAVNLHLVIILTDTKFFNKNFKSEFDQLIIKYLENIILVNLESGFNSNYYVGYANIYKGIFLKDNTIIYTGLLLLQSCDSDNKQNIADLIEIFIKKYNIKNWLNYSLINQLHSY